MLFSGLCWSLIVFVGVCFFCVFFLSFVVMCCGVLLFAVGCGCDVGCMVLFDDLWFSLLSFVVVYFCFVCV